MRIGELLDALEGDSSVLEKMRYRPIEVLRDFGASEEEVRAFQAGSLEEFLGDQMTPEYQKRLRDIVKVERAPGKVVSKTLPEAIYESGDDGPEAPWPDPTM